MAYIVPQLQSEEIESETMEQVDFFDHREVEFADFSVELGDIEKKPEIEECNVLGKSKRTLVILWEKLIACKRISQDQWQQYVCGGQVERTRTYHIWPGNNVVFFCGGRLMCGPDPKGLLLTTVSISLSSWIFAVYVAYDLPNYSGLISTFSGILTIIALVNLGMVSMIDPGIIPRNDGAFHTEVGTSDRRKKKRVIVNGVEVKLKYCHICKIYRPPRSCHCAVCDNCVEKFDHHCPWIGQCIGLRNYRYYQTFLVTALVFFVYTFAFSCRRIHQMMLRNGSGIFGIIKNRAETLAVASFSIAAICFLGGLACYHIYLVAINQTAYENYRGRYVGTKSPYDKGILSNVKEALFMPIPPSRVDFRAEVTPWCSGSMDSNI